MTNLHSAIFRISIRQAIVTTPFAGIWLASNESSII